MKNQPFSHRLRNALMGIRFIWQEENSFRSHVVLTCVTLLVFALLQPALIWWGIILLCITLVLAAEMVNSAIEALIDHLHPELHPIVGKVKDMLAGMVLVVSIGVALIGLLAVWATLA